MDVYDYTVRHSSQIPNPDYLISSFDASEQPLAAGAFANAAPVSAAVLLDPYQDPVSGAVYALLTDASTRAVSFRGQVSDPEGDLSSFSWIAPEVGATPFSTAQNPVGISFAANADYTITFTASERFAGTNFPGRSIFDTITLVVKNRPVPVLQYRNTSNVWVPCSPPPSVYPVKRGVSVPFNGEGSLLNDPLGYPLSFAWDFDDDGLTDTDTVYANFTFETNGLRTVRLIVTDQYSFSQTGAFLLYVSEGGTEVPSAPPAVVLLSPADGATGVPVDTAFRWSDVAAETTGPLTYELYISENADFSVCLPIVVNPNNSAVERGIVTFMSLSFVLGLAFTRRPFSHKTRKKGLLLLMMLLTVILVSCPVPQPPANNTPPVDVVPSSPLQAGTHYFWKVRAVNPSGIYSESTVWSFTTE